MAEIHRYASVPSTMDIAHELARGGAEHGTAVIAEEQTGGRGTRGRTWDSGKGGLWLSVVYRPKSPRELDLLSIRSACQMCAILEGSYPDLPRIKIKWPNDLFLAGKKLGGILCEAKWQGQECVYVVVGVGINHSNDLPPELSDTATRVIDHTQHNQFEGMAEWMGRWITEMLPLLPAEVTEWEPAYWAGRDELLGRRVETPLPGIASGFSSRGALRVLGDDGVMREATSGVAPSAS